MIGSKTSGADITSGKLVLAFLFICRISVAQKSAPSASPDTKESLQMEEFGGSLQYEKEAKRKRQLAQAADGSAFRHPRELGYQTLVHTPPGRDCVTLPSRTLTTAQ